MDNDITRAGSAYFEKFPSVFFETFFSIFDKNIVSHWCNEKHLVYMIGSTLSLAKAFLQLLNATDTTDNEADENCNHFVCEDEQIKLRHLWMNGGPHGGQDDLILSAKLIRIAPENSFFNNSCYGENSYF